jgi:hypothetical protein
MKFKTESGKYIDVKEDNIVCIGSITNSKSCYIIIKGNPKVHKIKITEEELKNNIKTLNVL